MLSWYARHWWAFLIRGIAAIIFGILAFPWPEETLQVLVALFGAYAIVDGSALLLALVAGDSLARRNGWATALMGVIGIGAGIATFIWPDITALALLYIVAVWSIATGVVAMGAAVALRNELEGEFWLGLSGLISVIFGTLLIVFPGEGLISLVFLVAIWAISFGVSNLALAYELRGVSGALKGGTSAAPAA